MKLIKIIMSRMCEGLLSEMLSQPPSDSGYDCSITNTVIKQLDVSRIQPPEINGAYFCGLSSEYVFSESTVNGGATQRIRRR